MSRPKKQVNAEWSEEEIKLFQSRVRCNRALRRYYESDGDKDELKAAIREICAHNELSRRLTLLSTVKLEERK